MATPSVVQKIPLTKDSNDKHCDNVCSRSVRANFNSPRKISSCRFNSNSWCAVCEHQLQTEFKNRRRANSEVLSDSYSLEETRDVMKDKGLSSFNLDFDFHKVISPMSVTPQKNIFDTHEGNLMSSRDFGCSNVDKLRTAVTGTCGKTWLSTCASDVQERYLKEVEVLRGKLIELRENLPLRKDSPSNNNYGLNNLKLLASKETKTLSTPQSVQSPKYDVSAKFREQKRSYTADGSRMTFPDQVETSSLNLIANLKRPRDGSPWHNQVEGREGGSREVMKKQFSKEINSSLLLESEEEDDGENSEVELLEEELGAGDDFSTEDMTRSIHHSLKMSSVSPPHLNGSSDETFSLEDSTSTSVQKPLESVHPCMRPSLFPNVPPYIKFTSHEAKAEADFPLPIQRILKWRLTSITPIVVRKTISNSGYKLIRKSPEWTGTWGKQMKSICFKTLKENQKLNHFPGTFQIGRKDKLWKNLYRLMTKYGKREFGFIPQTYILPQDCKHLRSVWERHGGKAKWIIKPPASARGSGIKVVSKWTQIPKKIPLIVQKYISNPYLINGSKFDLRLYVLVTSFNPLRIYLYDNGLVRFASVKYSDDMNSLADRYMHLTNYSINKLSSQYTQNEDAEACQGHKWTVKTLWTYLEGTVNINVLWKNLSELVIKTMIGGESSISQLTWANLPSRYCSYELFGVDVLLDENLRPWLLEVNISPSLHSTSPLDLAVKGPMVKDIMNIAGYHIPNKLSTLQEEEVMEKFGMNGSTLCYDPRMYAMGLSPEEKKKQNYFSEIEDREMYLDAILEELTPDDVRHLVQYEDELTQLGSFEKVFPTSKTHRYQRFFESCRYYNMLFDAWETKYHKNRMEGVKLLETLCHKKVHLDISRTEKRRSQVCVSDSGTIIVESPDPDRTSLKSSGWSRTSANSASDPLKRSARLHLGKVGYTKRPYPRRTSVVATRRQIRHNKP